MPRHRIAHRPRALLVIDVQELCIRRPHFTSTGVADFLVAQNELIASGIGTEPCCGTSTRHATGPGCQVLSAQKALRDVQAN